MNTGKSNYSPRLGDIFEMQADLAERKLYRLVDLEEVDSPYDEDYELITDSWGLMHTIVTNNTVFLREPIEA